MKRRWRGCGKLKRRKRRNKRNLREQRHVQKRKQREQRLLRKNKKQSLRRELRGHSSKDRSNQSGSVPHALEHTSQRAEMCGLSVRGDSYGITPPAQTTTDTQRTNFNMRHSSAEYALGRCPPSWRSWTKIDMIRLVTT